MINRRSFITGIKNTKLTSNEIKFLTKYKPWGIILFSRNFKNIKQIKSLTNQIRKIFEDKNYPILIDQEGGRVNRLKKFFNTDLFTGEFFGKLYKNDFKKFKKFYEIFTNRTSDMLKLIGANVNTVPVLDIRVRGASKIIGDRAFSKDPKLVSKLGDICIKNYHNNNIGTVIKHIPGHGLAKVDSHKLTPIVKEKFNKLKTNDFSTFIKKKSFLAMTAHIIFKDIDPINTVTHSKKIIKIIRNDIKFNNILMSDDISMKGLKYSIKQNTLKAFDAGCDLVLHCSGNLNEMLVVADNSPHLSKFIIKKTSQFYKFLS